MQTSVQHPFQEIQLNEFFEQNDMEIYSSIGYENDSILNVPIDQVVKKLYERYKIDPIDIDFTSQDKSVSAKKDDVAIFIFKYEYSGETDLFRCTPSNSDCEVYEFHLSILDDGRMHFILQTLNDIEKDSTRSDIRERAMKILDFIKCCLSEVNEEVRNYNESLKSKIEGWIEDKRELSKKKKEERKKLLDDIDPLKE